MNQQVLIYDDKCPLCVCYTRAFVKWGLLKPEERQSFSNIQEEWLQQIDFERATNEIPYLNTGTGNVVYGIDAMLEIIGRKLPWVRSMGRLRPVKWLLTRVYKLISYNRKVIVAVKCGPGTIDCSPAFSYFYRWLFMGLFLVVNTLLLFPVHDHLLTAIPGYDLSIGQLHLYHAALVGTNMALAFVQGKRFATDYLGQINMLAIITMLSLGVYILMAQWLLLPPLCAVLFLAAVFMGVTFEYSRRIHFLGLDLKKRRLISLNIIPVLVFLILLFK